jgi:hypothetical protein
MTKKSLEPLNLLVKIEDTKDVLYQELITYKIVSGMVTKQVATRKFKKGGDYIDSWSYNPLCEIIGGALKGEDEETNR